MGLEGLLRLDPRALRDALRRGDAADLSPAERARLEQHIRSRLRDASQKALDTANPFVETTVEGDADRLHRQWVSALEEFEGAQALQSPEDFTPLDPEDVDTGEVLADGTLAGGDRGRNPAGDAQSFPPGLGPSKPSMPTEPPEVEGEGADDVLGPAQTQAENPELPDPNEPQQILYDLQGGRRTLGDEELRELHARARSEAESREYERHRLDWPPASPPPEGWVEESYDWRALQRHLGDLLMERGIEPLPKPEPRPYRQDIGDGISLVAIDASGNAGTTAEHTAAGEPIDDGESPDGDAEQNDESSRRTWGVIAVGAGVTIALTIFGVVQALSSDGPQTVAAEQATSTTAEPTTTSTPTSTTTTVPPTTTTTALAPVGAGSGGTPATAPPPSSPPPTEATPTTSAPTTTTPAPPETHTKSSSAPNVPCPPPNGSQTVTVTVNGIPADAKNVTPSTSGSCGPGYSQTVSVSGSGSSRTATWSVTNTGGDGNSATFTLTVTWTS